MKYQKGYELTNKGKELSKWVDNWLAQDAKEDSFLHRKVSNDLPETVEEE